MKLKLELQDGVTVLRVTEELSVAQVAVLRAGLIKIFGQNTSKKNVVLDLCEATIADSATELALLQLRTGLVAEAVLIIASPNKAFAQAATAAEAVQQLGSGLAGLQSNEFRLKQRLSQLEAQKAAILGKASGGISDAQFLSLRRENSDLKRSVRELESLMSQVLSKRSANRAVNMQMAQIKRSLIIVLQQQGVLEIT